MSSSAVASRPALTVSPQMRPSFVGALHSETTKLSRQLMTWLLLAGMALAFATLAAVTLGLDPGKILARSPAQFYGLQISNLTQTFQIASGIALLMMAARLGGMEYTAGTVRVLLGRGVGRLQLFAAKLVLLVIVGLLMLAAWTVLGIAFTWILAAHFGASGAVPERTWTDLKIGLVTGATSVLACVVIGLAAAALGRSLAFAAGAALSFFPADNFGVLVLSLMERATHNAAWLKPSLYLLGPNLNVMLGRLQPDHAAGASFAAPLLPVDADHVLLVVGTWIAGLLLVSLFLTWRRDVLE